MADCKLVHLPDLVWNRIAEQLDPETFVTFRYAIPELDSTIKETICVQSLFPTVFEVLYDKSYVDSEDAKSCREVCHKWCSGVDKYFQTTNFDTIKNIHGARNHSDFILTLPLRLEDINRIYELDLHPRCVSFGKKLTLKMRGYPPRHRRELRDMVLNVTRVWKHFEHLEVQQMDLSADTDRMIPIDFSEPEVFVPYGQLGRTKNIKICKAMEHKKQAKTAHKKQSWYRKFRPDRFETYIPFLQHLTNLKTVTLLLIDRHKICQILLRIPRIDELERIFIGSNLVHGHVSWHTLMSMVYLECCQNLTFLSGCEIKSLEKFINHVESLDTTKGKFENLTELHVTVPKRQHLDTLLRVIQRIDWKLGDFFPKLTVLQVKIASDVVYANILNILNEFALQFPKLTHFSLAGRCVPSDSLNLDQFNNATAATNNITATDRRSSITTFQFECPSHVPLKLMQCFALLKHVIIAEQPGRCRRRVSKSKDRAYIGAFFEFCESHVRTLTFVPASYLELFEVLLFEPGAVTYCRPVKQCQGKKRKREDD